MILIDGVDVTSLANFISPEFVYVEGKIGNTKYHHYLKIKDGAWSLMTGTTKVLDVIAKPALIQWAANMAVDHIKDNFESTTYNIEGNWESLLKEARTAHRKKKEDAAQKGTDVHAILEDIIKGAIDQSEGFINVNTHENPQVQKFIEWALDKKVKFLDSEKKVYSESKWYAGTLDFLCEIDGKKYIGDIKTSNGIYGREYFFQCAAYRQCLEEMGEKDFHGTVIVRIGKDGSFEVKESFDYETDVKGFNAALELYRIINNN